MNRKLLTAVALAAAPLFAAGFASNAMATVELELTSGLSTTGIYVGAPCGTETCVSYSGTVGAWTINLTSGNSAGPGNPTMDLSSLNATSSGSAQPLHIELSDNGFSVGSPLFLLVSSGHLVSGSGTATYSAYFDTGNTDFAETTLIGTLGPFSALYAASTTGAGTAGTWGYYRNASGGTNSATSLLGSDFRSLGLSDQGLGMRLYNTVPAPEPVSMTL